MGKNHIGWRLLRPWRSRKIKAINKHLRLSYRWFAEISKLDTRCRCGEEFHFVHETTTRNSYYRLRSHPCPHILRRYPGVTETLALLENLKYSAGAIDALLGNPVPPNTVQEPLTPCWQPRTTQTLPLLSSQFRDQERTDQNLRNLLRRGRAGLQYHLLSAR